MLLERNRLDELFQEQYKTKKREVRNTMHAARTSYSKDEMKKCKGDGFKTWQTIKKIIPTKGSHSEKVEYDDDLLKANEFNEFFSNVGRCAYEKSQKNLNNCSLENPDTRDANISLRFRPKPTDVDTIILTIKDLHETNATGCDNIALRFVKDALPVIVFLLILINVRF